MPLAAALILWLAAPSHAVQEPSPAELRRRAAAVLERGDYQRRFPPIPEGGAAGVAPPPVAAKPPAAIDFPAAPILGLVARVLLGCVALIALVALGLFLGRLRRGRALGARGGAGRAASAVPRAATFDLAAARGLAAAGDHAGAVHALLLAVVDHLELSGVAVPPHLTGREIPGATPLPAEQRVRLEALVAAVEASHFAARPADAALWEKSLVAAEALVAWRPGAAA